jgi:hypothetical protein
MSDKTHQGGGLASQLRAMALDEARSLDGTAFLAQVEKAAAPGRAKERTWLLLLPLALVLTLAFMLSVHFMLQSSTQWTLAWGNGGGVSASAMLNQIAGLMLSGWCAWLVWQCRDAVE